MDYFNFDMKQSCEQASENGFIVGTHGQGKSVFFKDRILPTLLRQVQLTQQDLSDEALELLVWYWEQMSPDVLLRVIAKMAEHKQHIMIPSDSAGESVATKK